MSIATLYDYWRSSASYRVRIALNLAGIAYESISINLLEAEHKSREHLARHPQGLVPVLEIDGHEFTQSLAILEYLDTTRKQNWIPDDPAQATLVRALAHTVAVDVHPVCNLSVVAHVASLVDNADGTREAWMKHFIRPGLLAFEQQLQAFEQSPFATGNEPGLVDICLIPQLYNAIRWEVDYQDCPRIRTIQSACESHASFLAAHPDSVKRV